MLLFTGNYSFVYQSTFCLDVQLACLNKRTLLLLLLLHCALAAAQCIVIGPVCVFVGLLPR